ncbi:enoyl-CoA hydratase/isomerase family protein [Vreelandella nigrificans]|uniref:Enoyl-CoA hydratase n=1 Tax=Vreelandella nigrificans TaxID=2042704 RepID=A0A2A4HQY1_9GAMM|nr:enoyl-CoA hydratase/isomerase family protein [Halomonas nigrificans]PCF97342.1 enoyl-CoA hydratase [Halomonas nigrificans]
MAYSTLLIEDGIARLTLNRPEVHNAFDDSLIAELNSHLDRLHQLAKSGDVRVVVLGSEGKSFSAGADLNWMKRMVDYDLEDNLADSRKLAALMYGLDSLPCPTVCRVQGAAFGGAVGLAACCDLVVASDKAKFCLSEVKVGLSPAVISPYVQRALGERQMRRYALTAEVIDAQTALALGLAHQVVDHEALDNAIDAMLDTLLAGSPQAQRATKALLARVAQAPDSDATREHTCQVIAELRVSPEGQEGLSSFFEKRRPVWTQPSNSQEHNNAAEPRS